MLPTTILAAQKLAALLTASSAIEDQISSMAAESGIDIPVIAASQVFLSSAPAGMAELQQELGYPRISVFSAKVKNTQLEKFRSLSGTVTVSAEIAATADLLSNVDTWIHFYVEAITNVLRENRGDWGDGVFYSGAYEVDVQPPKAGASGFLQLARINFEVGVSRN
jgi:hypothetical protein